jgi:hypothetical protein
MDPMNTVGETRLSRLHMLLKKYGSIANLNEALQLSRTDATLSQIKNQSTTSRGNPKIMGETLARRIESCLGLEVGWMDTPPTYAEMHGLDDPRSRVWDIVAQMPDQHLGAAYRLMAALQGPEPQPPEPVTPRAPLALPSDYVKAHQAQRPAQPVEKRKA